MPGRRRWWNSAAATAAPTVRKTTDTVVECGQPQRVVEVQQQDVAQHHAQESIMISRKVRTARVEDAAAGDLHHAARSR